MIGVAKVITTLCRMARKDWRERHHANVAHKVVGSLDINVPAMTDGELLAAARAWFDEPIHKR